MAKEPAPVKTPGKSSATVTENAPPPISEAPYPWAWVRSHLWIHRPFYLWLPIIVVGIWAALHGYYSLTGRTPVDDLPVGALWNVLILIVAIILTNNVKPRLFDDIDTTKETRWWRVAIDTFETCFLLVLFCYVLTH